MLSEKVLTDKQRRTLKITVWSIVILVGVGSSWLGIRYRPATKRYVDNQIVTVVRAGLELGARVDTLQRSVIELQGPVVQPVEQRGPTKAEFDKLVREVEELRTSLRRRPGRGDAPPVGVSGDAGPIEN